MPRIHIDNIEKHIIDELCSCGHLKSAHGSTISEGHGGCQLCACTKFTFIDWVLVTESQNRDKYQRTPVG